MLTNDWFFLILCAWMSFNTFCNGTLTPFVQFLNFILLIYFLVNKWLSFGIGEALLFLILFFVGLGLFRGLFQHLGVFDFNND